MDSVNTYFKFSRTGEQQKDLFISYIYLLPLQHLAKPAHVKQGILNEGEGLVLSILELLFKVACLVKKVKI